MTATSMSSALPRSHGGTRENQVVPSMATHVGERSSFRLPTSHLSLTEHAPSEE